MIRVFIWDIIADEEIDPMPGRRSSFDSPGVMNTVPEVNTVQVQRGIRFEVWDTGVGLGSINPDTLFEPFSQGV